MTTETLYVNGFNSVQEQWTKVGASPWLNDSDSTYIYTKTDEFWHEEFTFANGSGSGTINSVHLYMEIQGSALRNDFVVVDVHDGTSWNNIANLDPDNDVYQWFNFDISTMLNSWTKIDAAKLRVQYQRSGSPGTEHIYIRRAYLYVDYTIGGQVIDIYVDAVAGASATKTAPTTYNVSKTASIGSQATVASQSTWNLLRDAVAKAFATANIEVVSPQIIDLYMDAIAQAAASVDVQISEPQIIDLYLDAVSHASATVVVEEGAPQIIDIYVDAVATCDCHVIVEPSTVEYTSYGLPFEYADEHWYNILFRLQVYMRATSGEVYARLLNETDGVPVQNSHLTTTETAMQSLRTAPLVLIDGKRYRLQFGKASPDAGAFVGGKLVGIAPARF